MYLNETSLSHDGGSKVWHVTASESWSISKLRKLAEQHPDEVKIYHENDDGSILVELPRNYVKFSAPKRMNLTDEQRVELAEKARKNFKKHGLTPMNETSEEPTQLSMVENVENLEKGE